MATRLPFKVDVLGPKGQPPRDIPVSQLLLDTENPRLGLSDARTQETVLRELYEGHRLEELMYSLIENGYFSEEPVVAVRHRSKRDFFVVVEGNRRLAALKLLLEPELRSRLRIGELPDATPAQLNRLRQIPVKEYDKREDVLPYLGFRHITGIKEWDAASKARYVYQLKQDSPYALADIARMIGDTYNMTERLYLGWSLLVQAELELGVIRTDFYKFPFSYLYDAVRMPEIRAFLGIPPDGKYRVPKSGAPHLRELITWLFGSQSNARRPIVEKKEQLKQLAYAVGDKNGLSSLRRGLSLDEAYRETVGERDQLLNWLTRASKDLDNAKGIVHRHKKLPEVAELVQKCAETAARLASELRL